MDRPAHRGLGFVTNGATGRSLETWATVTIPLFAHLPASNTTTPSSVLGGHGQPDLSNAPPRGVHRHALHTGCCGAYWHQPARALFNRRNTGCSGCKRSGRDVPPTPNSYFAGRGRVLQPSPWTSCTTATVSTTVKQLKVTGLDSGPRQRWRLHQAQRHRLAESRGQQFR